MAKNGQTMGYKTLQWNMQIQLYDKNDSGVQLSISGFAPRIAKVFVVSATEYFA
jgi:hypothetical protein